MTEWLGTKARIGHGKEPLGCSQIRRADVKVCETPQARGRDRRVEPAPSPEVVCGRAAPRDDDRRHLGDQRAENLRHARH